MARQAPGNMLELYKEQARRSLERGWPPEAQQVLSDNRIVMCTASKKDEQIVYEWLIDGKEVSEFEIENVFRSDPHLGRQWDMTQRKG